MHDNSDEKIALIKSVHIISAVSSSIFNDGWSSIVQAAKTTGIAKLHVNKGNKNSALLEDSEVMKSFWEFMDELKNHEEICATLFVQILAAGEVVTAHSICDHAIEEI